MVPPTDPEKRVRMHVEEIGTSLFGYERPASDMK